VLQQLQLHNNSFKGRIPQSLQNIKGLSALNLSMNKLFGTIPSAIGNIKALQMLYLAYNNLSGPIPAVLENLTSLSELDLSFNNLQGEVPKEGIFRNMAKFSIDGNSELCGGIPQLHLAQCQKNSVKRNRTRHLKSLTIALAIVGAVLFLLASIAALFQLVNTFRKWQNPLLHK
jgi:Leucine-rich repeat (LRR) protein